MNEPKISVIVPIYNAIKYLGKALDSLLAISEPSIEIILVDDGSTDGSGELCDSVSDARVRVIHKENGGVSSARNAGIESARGEWLSFVDADDSVEPGMYSSLLARTEATGAEIAQCAMLCIDEAGGESIVFSPKRELITDAPYSPKLLTKWLCYGCCSKIYKRSAVGDVRFDTRFAIGEDLMFNLECLKKTNRLLISPTVGYRYLQHGGSATHTATSGEKLLSCRNMLKAALSLCDGASLKKYITDCQLNNNTDVISKIILSDSAEYKDAVAEIRRECRGQTAFILFSSNLSPVQRLKILAIGYLFGLYSRMLKRKKRGI